MKKTGLFGLLAVLLVGGGMLALGKFLPGLLKTILVIGGVAIAAIIALIVIGIVLAVKSSSTDAKRDKTGKITLDDDQAAVLSKGREQLMELRRLVMRIKNQEIHTKANEICTVADKILQTLKQKPEKIQSVRQFLNYYLPTLGEILSKYKRIEESGVPHEETTTKVSSYLTDIKRAMDKQYENLFADDILDMSVEMEAMTLAAKRDGLIVSESVEVPGEDHTINLTL